MKIAGYLKNSFVDYPGQIACVLFVPGCNLDCYFCHNKHLLKDKTDEVSQEAVFDFLKKRTSFLDAVVITGGEPTIHKGLDSFIGKVADMGYLVKVDSNGFRPDVLADIIGKGRVSYIAVDFKAPYQKYDSVTNRQCDLAAFKETVKLVISSGIDHEFRTTFIPELTQEDILAIAEEIKGAANYYIQQFKPLQETGGFIDMRAAKRPHVKEYIFQTAESAKKILITTNVSVRGVK